MGQNHAADQNTQLGGNKIDQHIQSQCIQHGDERRKLRIGCDAKNDDGGKYSECLVSADSGFDLQEVHGVC